MVDPRAAAGRQLGALVLSGTDLTEWVQRVWSPGLQTTHFTEAQRQVWQLDPARAYLQLSTGGDPELDSLMRSIASRPDCQSLLWAWRRGGYWVLCLGPASQQETAHD